MASSWSLVVDCSFGRSSAFVWKSYILNCQEPLIPVKRMAVTCMLCSWTHIFADASQYEKSIDGHRSLFPDCSQTLRCFFPKTIAHYVCPAGYVPPTRLSHGTLQQPNRSRSNLILNIAETQQTHLQNSPSMRSSRDQRTNRYITPSLETTSTPLWMVTTQLYLHMARQRAERHSHW